MDLKTKNVSVLTKASQNIKAKKTAMNKTDLRMRMLTKSMSKLENIIRRDLQTASFFILLFS